MKQYISGLKKRYISDMGHSAQNYLETGLELFHRHYTSQASCSQIAVSVMGTGLELLIKTFIAERDLGAIFKEMPADVRVLLSCADELPEFYEWRKFDMNLHSESFTTLDLAEAVTCLHIFYPPMKQLLVPHLKFLRRWTEMGTHHVMPPVGTFDFERTGYAVLQVMNTIGPDIRDDSFVHEATRQDLDFIREFENERQARVARALENSRLTRWKSDVDGLSISTDGDWETLTVHCPACESYGFAEGYTEIAVAEGGTAATLDFFATEFSCESCGLVLNDIEEMKLANMPILYDRSFDIDRWLHEHRSFADLYIEHG